MQRCAGKVSKNLTKEFRFILRQLNSLKELSKSDEENAHFNKHMQLQCKVTFFKDKHFHSPQGGQSVPGSWFKEAEITAGP